MIVVRVIIMVVTVNIMVVMVIVILAIVIKLTRTTIELVMIYIFNIKANPIGYLVECYRSLFLSNPCERSWIKITIIVNIPLNSLGLRLQSF